MAFFGLFKRKKDVSNSNTVTSSSISFSDLKKTVLIMDSLLGDLADDKIDYFMKTKDYKLYESVLKALANNAILVDDINQKSETKPESESNAFQKEDNSKYDKSMISSSVKSTENHGLYDEERDEIIHIVDQKIEEKLNELKKLHEEHAATINTAKQDNKTSQESSSVVDSKPVQEQKIKNIGPLSVKSDVSNESNVSKDTKSNLQEVKKKPEVVEKGNLTSRGGRVDISKISKKSESTSKDVPEKKEVESTDDKVKSNSSKEKSNGEAVLPSREIVNDMKDRIKSRLDELEELKKQSQNTNSTIVENIDSIKSNDSITSAPSMPVSNQSNVSDQSVSLDSGATNVKQQSSLPIESTPNSSETKTTDVSNQNSSSKAEENATDETQGSNETSDSDENIPDMKKIKEQIMQKLRGR